jgi:2-haloacid dehalogenase
VVLTFSGNGEGIRACLFDVFGTVVEWQARVSRALAACASSRGVSGVGWLGVPIDLLHRENLGHVLDTHGLSTFHDDIDEMNLAWHRLNPWPDAVEVITRLKSGYVVAPVFERKHCPGGRRPHQPARSNSARR